jgi:hypothetical protein
MNDGIANGSQAVNGRLKAVEGRVRLTSNQLQEIKDQAHDSDNRFSEIEGQVQRILSDTTDVRNMQRRAMNRRVTESTASSVAAQRAFTPLVTRHGQYGNGMVGMNPYQSPIRVRPGREIPSPPFPATLAAIDAMGDGRDSRARSLHQR